MSNKEQFERLIDQLDPHKYEELWGLVGPLQFIPAFRHISQGHKEKFIKGISDNDIKNIILEDDQNLWDQDPEECRQLILDNAWRILQRG
jgi:Mg/Co/Ni transporter MgtE